MSRRQPRRPTRTEQQPKNSRSWQWLPIAAALLLLNLFVFSQVTRFQFLGFDDPDYVADNPVVAAGLPVDGVVWAFTTTHASNWHPVTWLSHMLDAAMYG